MPEVPFNWVHTCGVLMDENDDCIFCKAGYPAGKKRYLTLAVDNTDGKKIVQMSLSPRFIAEVMRIAENVRRDLVNSSKQQSFRYHKMQVKSCNRKLVPALGFTTVILRRSRRTLSN